MMLYGVLYISISQYVRAVPSLSTSSFLRASCRVCMYRDHDGYVVKVAEEGNAFDALML